MVLLNFIKTYNQKLLFFGNALIKNTSRSSVSVQQGSSDYKPEKIGIIALFCFELLQWFTN